MESISTNFLRSNTVESTHYAKVLIKDIKGKSILTTGNDEDHIYPRSSIKIFQAIPFVSSGAIKNFKLNDKIIALSCSSHRGEKYHIEELEKWLKKINIRLTDLKCGQHYPLNQQAKEKILLSNNQINQLYNNCAGKHLAMISSCIQFKYDIDNYLNFDHPHQIKIREVFEKFSESKIYKKSYGIDGCSAPQYSFKLKEISKLLSETESVLKKNIRNKNVDINREDKGVKITLRGKLFPSASAKINDNLIPLLQNIGGVTVNAPLFTIYSKDDPENVKKRKDLL